MRWYGYSRCKWKVKKECSKILCKTKIIKEEYPYHQELPKDTIYK